MKILLVAINAKYSHTSLSVRYLQKCIGCEICEFTINHSADYITRELFLKTKNVKAIGFSVYIWNVELITEISSRMKKIRPDLYVFWGGPEATFDAEEILAREFVDFVLMGEGESVIKEFTAALSSGRFEKVRGLAYKQDGVCKINPPVEIIQDLDCIEFPYTPDDLANIKDKIVYYETSRGCPYSCAYCLSSRHGDANRVRYFSLERVKRDLRIMINSEVSQIKFVDRTFNSDAKRAAEIVSYLLDHDSQTKFHFEIAADILDCRLIELFQKAPVGKFQLEIGVQSTNRETLDKVNRRCCLNKLYQAVEQLTRNNNLHIHLDLIAGLPGEHLHSFKKSFNQVYALQPNNIQLGFLKMLKGTSIREIKGYKYANRAPYEVLVSPEMGFEDFLVLKGIEDLVEKYYNSNAFKNSLNYLINMFATPFEFYDQLWKYFYANDLTKISHSRISLYTHLRDFSLQVETHKCPPYGTVAEQYILFDMYLNNPGAAIPKWSGIKPERSWYKSVYEYIFIEREKYIAHYQTAAIGDILKTTRIYPFGYDVINNIDRSVIILFDYKSVGKTVLLTMN